MTEGWLRDSSSLSPLLCFCQVLAEGLRGMSEIGAGFSDDLDAAPGQELVLC